MRGADDNARTGARGAREIGDSGGRQGAEKADVDPGGGKAGFEGRFQQVSRYPGVLADQDFLAAAGGGEYAPGRPAELHHRLRGERLFAYAAADAIGAKQRT